MFLFADGSDLELRLVGGGSRCAGTVEVEIQKRVGKVCSNSGWYMENANIVCRHLGCGSALKKSYQVYSKPKATNTWLIINSCVGNETSLWDCTNWQWGGISCHYGDAEITCSGKVLYQFAKKFDPNIVNIQWYSGNSQEILVSMIGIFLITLDEGVCVLASLAFEFFKSQRFQSRRIETCKVELEDAFHGNILKGFLKLPR